jgi:hypothetical protein
MRLAASIALILLLASCGGGGPAPLPTDQVRASFPPGGLVDVIAVDAVDRLPLRQVELIAPDGHATAANSLIANPAPTQNFYQQFPAGPYSGTGFDASDIGSNALSPGVVGGAPQTQTQLLAVISTASITLPDPVAYRRDWQKYRIRLRFGTPPDQVETREIAAPAPPPGSG